MDPVTIGALASGVVAALVPYLAMGAESFAKEAGKTAVDKVGALYQAIKTRFKDHPTAAEALADAEATPKDADAQASLRLQLKKQITADPVWADTLRQLLEAVGEDKQAATFLTQVYGGEVGKIVNIGQVTDVLID